MENPLGLLRLLGSLLEPGGRVLVETYGIAGDGSVDQSTIEVKQRGEVYAGDDYVYWGFAAGGLAALGRLAGLPEVEVSATQMVDGHPRIPFTSAEARPPAAQRPGGHPAPTCRPRAAHALPTYLSAPGMQRE